MKNNNNIRYLIKNKEIGLVILFLFQILSFSLFSIFICKFFSDTMIRTILIMISILLFLIVDFIYYKMHIKRLKYFINASPVGCVIEDFIVVSYGDTEQFGYKTKDYRIYPVVKMGNDFYFTYGDYSICHYQARIYFIESYLY